ncbi:Eco47II family restriction endonuclease [Bartonella sp. B10]
MLKKLFKNIDLELILLNFIQTFPIQLKLTFDTKVYRKSIKEVIKIESTCQMDKTNNNNIGHYSTKYPPDTFVTKIMTNVHISHKHIKNGTQILFMSNTLFSEKKA